MVVNARAWHRVVLLVLLVSTCLVIGRFFGVSDPPADIQAVCAKARELGWEVHSDYENGKAVVLLSRKINPEVKALGGSSQAGFLYVSEKSSSQKASKDAESFVSSWAWGKFFLRGDPSMSSILRR